MSNRRNVNEIIAIIQKKNAQIDGVNFAPEDIAEYPTGHLFNLPTVLTYPEAGNFSTKILGDKVKHSRIYLIRVFVAGHDGIQSDTLAETISLLTEFGFTWADTNVLAFNPEISMDKSEGDYVTDSGVLDYMEYAEQLYYGFEFRVAIYEKS